MWYTKSISTKCFDRKKSLTTRFREPLFGAKRYVGFVITHP